MKKLVLGLLLLFVLVLGGGLIFVSISGEDLVRGAVEREGPKILGAEVSLAGLSLSPLSGAVRMEGLRVGNPAGYSEADAIVADEITVELKPLSLFSDVIEVERIAIAAPVIRIEPGKGGALNLQAIERHVETYTGPAPEDTAPTPLRIARFDLTDARLVVGSGPIGFSDRSVPLPDLSLTDLGGPDGIAPGEVARKVFAALLPKIREALASRVGAELLADAKARLADFGGTARDALEGAKDKAGMVLKEQTEKLPDGLSEKADRALKSGIGDLLGKKNKKNEEEGDGGH